MKQVLLLAIGWCALSACKKDKPLVPGIFGKWELRRAYGGLSYRDSVYKPGNGTIYQFNSDSTYKHFTKNKLDGQGKFHIRSIVHPTANTTPNYEANCTILFDNPSYGDPLTITEGMHITLGTSLDDGIAVDYDKIAN